MSKREAILLVSRALALIWLMDAGQEVMYLPERLHAFFHYQATISVLETTNYLATQYDMAVAFLIARIAVFLVASRFFWRSGDKIAAFLLPAG